MESTETEPSYLRKTGMGDWDGGYRRRSYRDEDFEEEDVWSVGVNEREDSSPKVSKLKDYCNGGSSSAWRTAPRMIPRATFTNLSVPTTGAHTAHHEVKAVQQASAPVNIPDWSKIYGKNARIGSWTHDRGINPANYDEDGDYYQGNGLSYLGNDDGDDDDDDEDMVPPHEWIARKLERSQISSSSVYEGIGRTLKGRDLSKVRNAILTKTGFLE